MQIFIICDSGATGIGDHNIELSKIFFDLCKYFGTGFFVGVPSDDGAPFTFLYFVTAKHCVVQAQQAGTLCLRVNSRDGVGVLGTVDRGWLFPEDPSIDVAIIPWSLDPQDFALRCLETTSQFATNERLEQHEVGVGDDLVVAGLFTQRHGRERNLPIVRSGIIAAMPMEPFEDHNTGGSFRAYIAEMRSIGGLSGSPVFAFLRPGRVNRAREIMMNQRVFLLGMIRGHWDYRRRDGGPLAFANGELAQVNMGMALVTPAQDILDLLNRADVVAVRRRASRERQRQNPA